MAKKKLSGFSVGECVSFGWEATKKNIGFLFVLQLIMFGIMIAFGAISSWFEFAHMGFSRFLVQVVSWVVEVIIGIGLVGISLKYADGKGKNVAYGDLFGDINLFWRYLAGSILYALIVIGGLILLIVPGFIWAIKYEFWSYFVVEKKMGPVEALKASAKLTAGRKGTLFWLCLASVGIILLGIIALIVGLFWAVPTTYIATAYAYRKLASLQKGVRSPSKR